MREINLSKGKLSLVDDEDYERLNAFKWYMGSWYAQRSITISPHRKKIILMHKVIMGDRPGYEVDHINLNKLDNRRCNLRWVTRSQNMQNRGTWNKEGLKGVYLHRETGKYMSFVKVNKVRHYLGLFITKEEAHKAYCDAAIKYQGEFANV